MSVPLDTIKLVSLVYIFGHSLGLLNPESFRLSGGEDRSADSRLMSGISHNPLPFIRSRAEGNLGSEMLGNLYQTL